MAWPVEVKRHVELFYIHAFVIRADNFIEMRGKTRRENFG
jgi:hypothetical protein